MDLGGPECSFSFGELKESSFEKGKEVRLRRTGN